MHQLNYMVEETRKYLDEAVTAIPRIPCAYCGLDILTKPSWMKLKTRTNQIRHWPLHEGTCYFKFQVPAEFLEDTG